MTLVGIAPATNLALALMTEPALTAKIERIVLMTGAWGEGNATPAAEFNALNDPEALAVLLACGRPVVLATLELTAQALCTPAHLAHWRAAGTGRCLRTLCDIQATVPLGPRFAGTGAALHDPCAVAWLIRPDLFTDARLRRDASISAPARAAAAPSSIAGAAPARRPTSRYWRRWTPLASSNYSATNSQSYVDRVHRTCHRLQRRFGLPATAWHCPGHFVTESTMDPNALPFDADAMLDGLRTWVECESPTWDAAAVNRMMDIASRDLVIAGARIERVAGRMGFGDCVRATFPASDAERARHPGDGPSRHGASDRHAGDTAVPSRERRAPGGPASRT